MTFLKYKNILSNKRKKLEVNESFIFWDSSGFVELWEHSSRRHQAQRGLLTLLNIRSSLFHNCLWLQGWTLQQGSRAASVTGIKQPDLVSVFCFYDHLWAQIQPHVMVISSVGYERGGHGQNHCRDTAVRNLDVFPGPAWICSRCSGLVTRSQNIQAG